MNDAACWSAGFSLSSTLKRGLQRLLPVPGGYDIVLRRPDAPKTFIVVELEIALQLYGFRHDGPDKITGICSAIAQANICLGRINRRGTGCFAVDVEGSVPRQTEVIKIFRPAAFIDYIGNLCTHDGDVQLQAGIRLDQDNVTIVDAAGLFLYTTRERLAGSGPFGDVWASSKRDGISLLDQE